MTREEQIKAEIINIIEAKQKAIGFARQYPASKTRTRELEAAGVLQYMPEDFGNTDAQAVLDALKVDSGSARNTGGDYDTWSNTSKLYDLLNKVEEVEPTEEQIAFSEAQPLINARIERDNKALPAWSQHRAKPFINSVDELDNDNLLDLIESFEASIKRDTDQLNRGDERHVERIAVNMRVLMQLYVIRDSRVVVDETSATLARKRKNKQAYVNAVCDRIRAVVALAPVAPSADELTHDDIDALYWYEEFIRPIINYHKDYQIFDVDELLNDEQIKRGAALSKRYYVAQTQKAVHGTPIMDDISLFSFVISKIEDLGYVGAAQNRYKAIRGIVERKSALV